MVKFLSSDVVLGMDWLQQYNPVVDWVRYTLTFRSGGIGVEVHALPQSPVAHVELCSLDAVTKAVRCGATAWFGLLRGGGSGLANIKLGEGSTVGDKASLPSRWDKLCERFSDMFSEPG